MQCEEDPKTSIMGLTLGSSAKPQKILKNLFPSFLVAEPILLETSGHWQDLSWVEKPWQPAQSCWNQPFLMGKVGDILLDSDCESHRKVTPGLHSFKTWAIECFFFFLRSAEKDILHPWVMCSSVSHLFKMEKDSYLFLKRVFLTLQYTILKSTVAQYSRWHTGACLHL